jgi:hypothetical protein
MVKIRALHLPPGWLATGDGYDFHIDGDGGESDFGWISSSSELEKTGAKCT